ncbi:MAG: hypothetical protein CSA66_05755, partial [Proteobacteria bacterium]
WTAIATAAIPVGSSRPSTTIAACSASSPPAPWPAPGSARTPGHHDFWIITRPGEQETFRRWLDWLPDHQDVVLAFRETDHGLKVLFADGHLVEYAVFDPDELHVARVNSYCVLLDRERIGRRMEQIARATRQRHAHDAPDPVWAFGQFLTHLIVGTGRHARGELVSGHRFVMTHALEHLIRLIVAYVPADRPTVLDDLDPTRRFERAYPEIGGRVATCLEASVPAAARELLDVAHEVLSDRLPDYPAAAVEVVRLHLAQVSADGDGFFSPR